MLNFRTITEVVSISILLYGLLLYARIWRGIKEVIIPMDVSRLQGYLDFVRVSMRIQTELRDIVIGIAIIFCINTISICFCVVTEFQLVILFLAFTLFIIQNSTVNIFYNIKNMKKEERKYLREYKKNLIESQMNEFNSKDDTLK